jgi:hypothetical protein
MKLATQALLLALAAMAVSGCSKSDAASEDDAAPPKPPLQRLVGTLNVSDDYAMTNKAGVTVATRKMQLQGNIDQLVRVREGSEGSLEIETDGNVPLKMTGTVSENGQFAYDDPDSNSVVKGRGHSAWTGKLEAERLDLSIRASKLGHGDEVSFRFATPMSGKMETRLTTRDGNVVDLPPASAGFFITLLEENPQDPAQRLFKRDFALMPALGAVPSDQFSKMLYDGIKANPGVAHTGLVTSADRRSWTYSGTKNWVKDNAETKWVEQVTLHLRLTNP